MDRKLLGQRLRLCREHAGLSQATIAQQAGIIQGDLSLLERGEKHVWADTLYRLAETLGISTDYLFGRTDDPTPRQAQPVGETVAHG